MSEHAHYFADIPTDERKALAAKGWALPDGSYPIRNTSDLRSAITLAQSGHGNVAAAKALIRRRAKDLGYDLPEGFSDDEPFHALTLAEPADGELSRPFEVLKVGDYKKRGLKITESDLDRMVSNFTAGVAVTPEGLPIDYDHSHATGQGSKAAGWIKELVRDGGRLLARAKWTPQAAQEIGSGQYRLYSSEFHPNWEDEHGAKHGRTMLAGTLTNRPFLKQLAPVALSDAAEQLLADEARRLADLSGLEVSTGERSDSRSETRREMAEPTTITLTEEQHQHLLDAADKAEQAATKVEALSEANTKLSERLDETQRELTAERLHAALGQARREGRIDAAEETTQKWTDRVEKLGLETVKELLSELPAETIPMRERGHGGDKPVAAEGIVELNGDRVDAQRKALDDRATQILNEGKTSDYMQALTLAASELGVSL